jgi:hypothetical protein
MRYIYIYICIFILIEKKQESIFFKHIIFDRLCVKNKETENKKEIK